MTDEVRLVSYNPNDYSTATLNIDGEEYYYNLVGSTDLSFMKKLKKRTAHHL